MSFKLTLGKIGQPRQASHNDHNKHNAIMPAPTTGGAMQGGYHNQPCIQAG